MKNKTTRHYLVLLLGMGGLAVNAQNNTASSGGIATGSTGASSYSIGQAFYTSTTGSNGTTVAGLQNPFTIEVALGTEVFDIKLDVLAYPNPTTGILNLQIDRTDASDLTYQLFDLSGRLIKNDLVKDNNTVIDLSNQSTGNFVLTVSKANKNIKSFKIIKN